jgi:transmembrane sensor
MGETKTALIERLFVQQRSSLLAFFRRRVRATDSAELAQEVYLRMLRISDTDVIRNPEAYLYTVASNLAREHHVLEKRYTTRGDMDELPADGLITDLPSAASEIDTDLRVTRLREVLAQLSPKCQAVVAYGQEIPAAGTQTLSPPDGTPTVNPMTTADERTRMSIADQAADWFIDNRDGPMAFERRVAFAAWLKASPAHIEEYVAVAQLSDDMKRARRASDMSLEAALEQARSGDDAAVAPLGAWRGLGSDPAQGRSRTARASMPWLAAAAAALAAVAIGLYWSAAERVPALQYATMHGEQLTERLADNSVLHLNTDTAVTVRYTKAERLVEIERGQVLFEVAHEPGRPFRVAAGFAQVLAVGTKFDVYRRVDSTAVSVVEGAVAVELASGQPGAAAAAGRTVVVRAGERLQVSEGSLPAIASPTDPQSGTAWLRHEIVFEREPLGTVAAEFNRYGATPIEIATPELRSLQISGVFSANDPEAFVAFLRSLDSVKVEVTRTRIRVSRM